MCGPVPSAPDGCAVFNPGTACQKIAEERLSGFTTRCLVAGDGKKDTREKVPTPPAGPDGRTRLAVHIAVAEHRTLAERYFFECESSGGQWFTPPGWVSPLVGGGARTADEYKATVAEEMEPKRREGNTRSAYSDAWEDEIPEESRATFEAIRAEEREAEREEYEASHVEL